MPRMGVWHDEPAPLFRTSPKSPSFQGLRSLVPKLQTVGLSQHTVTDSVVVNAVIVCLLPLALEPLRAVALWLAMASVVFVWY